MAIKPWSQGERPSGLLMTIILGVCLGTGCTEYDVCEQQLGTLCVAPWSLRAFEIDVDDGTSLDVDGDGHLEYALLDRSASALSIVWAEEGRSETSQVPGLRELAVVDLDGDGGVDLAALCDGPPRIVPIYVRGGALVEGEAMLLADAPLSVATGDLDGDRVPRISSR